MNTPVLAARSYLHARLDSELQLNSSFVGSNFRKALRRKPFCMQSQLVKYMFLVKKISGIAIATILTATALPTVVKADEDNDYDSNRTVVYITRHAEKLDVLRPVSEPSGIYKDNCNNDRDRCEEALNAAGQLRAKLLADWFDRRGIADDVTHVISSDKNRTRDTVLPLVELIEITLPDFDYVLDGVWQVPFAVADADLNMANEINGNSGSVVPSVEAIQSLQLGSVAVLAAHSGTIYRILGGEDTDGNPATDKDGDFSVGLGIDTTTDAGLFPKKDNGKVPTFGDVWKVVIKENGTASVKWRKRLDFTAIQVVDSAFPQD